MTTIVTATMLMLRRHRLMIIGWSVLVVAVGGGTVRFYQSTYETAQQRRHAVELAQDSAASTLLYGRLPDPGTPAQMYAWEVGAIVTLLVAFMAVLLAVALTRAAEEDGTLEPLVTWAANPGVGIRSAYAVLVAVAGVLTMGCTVGLGITAGRVDGVTWAGALAFGSVVGVSFLFWAAAAVLFAQIFTTALAARVAGLALVAVGFAVRALADGRDGIGWLNWLSALALRATVGPFTRDRWWVLAVYAAVVVVLAWLAIRLNRRREYGAGLLPSRERSEARLHVRSGFGLEARLVRGTVLAWTIAVTCLGTLFAAMGAGAVEQTRKGDLDGFLGAQLGSGDPTAAYFAYTGTVVGIAVAVFAVLGVLRASRAEHNGLTDHVLATGGRRWQPLAAAVTVTATASALILLAAGTIGALVAPLAIEGADVAVRAFVYTVGQWPTAMIAAGWTALLVGLRPRLAWLAWVPLAVSGVLALLGPLLGISQNVRDLGIFQHVPDPLSASPHLGALALLLALSGVTILTGLAATAHRDITLG